MSVVKVRVQKDFTVLYNGVLENPRLSFKAKGLWAYCMSKSEDWQFHVRHLATVSKEGIDAVYSALKELENEGLVEKSQKNERGSFGEMDYIIYPFPPKLKEFLPHRDFPHPEDPHPVNPHIPSTDLLPRKKENQESSSSSTPPKPELSKSESIESELRRRKKITFNDDEFQDSLERLNRRPPGAVGNIYGWLEEDIKRAQQLAQSVQKQEPKEEEISLDERVQRILKFASGETDDDVTRTKSRE